MPKLNFTFTGIYIPPVDVALPAITYGQQSTPLVVKNGNTSGFQLLSYAGSMQALSIDAGIETEYMELVGGTKEVHLVNRATSGTVTLEAVKMSAKDYFAAALLDTSLGNLTFTHGTSNIDIGDVAYTETNGVVMAEIPFTAVPSTSGNDEFSLIYR